MSIFSFLHKVKCSLLFILLCVFVIVSENTSSFLLHMGALLLHEGAHYIMARMLGCRISQIKLLPYGCRMDIYDIFSPWDELMIALCGPVCSLICFMGCRFIHNAAEFADANMYIALINILPVFPLDGGRALSALLSMAGIIPSRTLKAVFTFILAGITGVCGCAINNITLVIFGIFLLSEGISALREQGRTALTYIKNARCAASGRGIRVHHMAFHKNVSLRTALSYVFGRYSVLYILDDNMKEIARADSTTIADMAAEHGSNARLCDIIPFIDRGKY